jgi:hypothetical protein
MRRIFGQLRLPLGVRGRKSWWQASFGVDRVLFGDLDDSVGEVDGRSLSRDARLLSSLSRCSDANTTSQR